MKNTLTLFFLLCVAIGATQNKMSPSKRLQGSGAAVTKLLLLNNGKQLLVGYENQESILWHIEDGKVLKRITGSFKAVDTLGQMAAFIDKSGLTIRRLSDFTEIFRFEGPNIVQVIFNATSELIAFLQPGVLRVWYLKKKTEIAELKTKGRSPASFAFSFDGQYLAASQHQTPEITIFDLLNQRILATLNPTGRKSSSLIAPNVALSQQAPRIAFNAENAIFSQNIVGKSSPCSSSEHTNFITVLEFSPGSKKLLSSGGRVDPRIIVWNYESCTPETFFKGHEDAVSSIAFLSDTEYVSGDESKHVFYWSQENASTPIELSGNSDMITEINCDPKLRLAAAGDFIGNVNIWKIPPKRQ